MANKCVNAATAAEIISQYTGIPLHQLVDIMAEVPSEDVEPVRNGHWVEDKYGSVFECSECGCSTDYRLSEYCPDCGAKMDGKENDNDQR